MQPASEITIREAIQTVVYGTYEANGLSALRAPHEDMAKSLAVEIDTLKVARESLHRQLSLDISALERRHNSLLPINRLPVEITVAIMELAVFDDFYRTSSPLPLKSVLRLRGVSTSWRDIVQDTTRLWTVIHVSAPPYVIQMAISNSKDRLIDIHYLSKTNHASPPPNTSSAPVLLHPTGSLNDVIPYLNRWNSAVLKIATQEELTVLARVPAPFLGSLRLEYVGHADELESLSSVNLFNGNAPRLRDLIVRSVPIEWNSDSLKGLETVKFSDLEVGPSIKQICSFLQECSQLQSFSIELEYLLEDAGEIDDPLVLPQLGELLLHLPYQYLYRLLPLIQGPNLTSLSISTSPIYTIGQTIENLLDLAFRYLFDKSDGWYEPIIHLNISDTTITFKLHESRIGNRLLTVSLKGIHPNPTLHWLVQKLDDIPTIPWTTRITVRTDYNIRSFYPALHSFPSVTELTVSRDRGFVPMRGTSSVVHRLSKPYATSGGSREWAFKDLRRLFLTSGPYDGQALLHMIQRRYGVSNHTARTVDNAPEPPVPVPLEYLEGKNSGGVSLVHRHQISSLVESAGGKVYWDDDEIVEVGSPDYSLSTSEDEPEPEVEIDLWS